MSRNSPEAGFSLVESLVVLALTALIVLSLAIASGMMIRGWSRTANAANATEALATAVAVISRDLSAAQRVRHGTVEDGGFYFRGNATGLGFAVTEGGTAPAPGLSLVAIDTRFERDRSVLTRSAAPVTPQVTTFAAARFGEPVVLLSGAVEIRFAYAAATPAGLVWTESWTNPRTLPAAVRLDFVDRSGRAGDLPPLVVPLRIDAEPGCISGANRYCSHASAEEGEGDASQDGGAPNPDGGPAANPP